MRYTEIQIQILNQITFAAEFACVTHHLGYEEVNPEQHNTNRAHI